MPRESKRPERLYSIDARDLTLRSVDLGYKPEAFSESADGRHVYVVTGNKNLILDLSVPAGRVVESASGIRDSYGLAAPWVIASVESLFNCRE